MTCLKTSLMVFFIILALCPQSQVQANNNKSNTLIYIARDNVLGTSLDISLNIDSQKNADQFEENFVKEVNRLCQFYNNYDSKSEVCQLNTLPLSKEVAISAEMYEILKRSNNLRMKSSNAFNVYTGSLTALWNTSAKNNKLPSAEEIKKLKDIRFGFSVKKVNSKKGYSYFYKKKSIGQLDLGGIAKGAIIDKALAYALRQSPCYGALVNIGGDIKTYGHKDASNKGWPIHIADPKNPADNAPPLTSITINNMAVTTSAGYARFHTIKGKKYSHIINPNTGKPADKINSATVVHAEAAIADALSTALCVLDVSKGLKLATNYKAPCLIVDKDNKTHSNKYWDSLGDKPVDKKSKQSRNDKWRNNYSVSINFELLQTTTNKKFRRHYVAAWVSDVKGKRIKVLALWFEVGAKKHWKYLKNLRNFWSEAYSNTKDFNHLENFAAISRATRPLGKYTLYWDGTNDQGKTVKPGTYVIHLDICRENGPFKERNSHAKAEVICVGKKQHSINPKDTGELASMTFTYSSKKIKN